MGLQSRRGVTRASAARRRAILAQSLIRLGERETPVAPDPFHNKNTGGKCPRASCPGWRGLALMWEKPSFLEKLADVALVERDAGPLGDDAPEVDTAPAHDAALLPIGPASTEASSAN